ncbi:MAG: CyaY protein [Candidatus Azotimanducaceae bacterium]
MVQGSIEQQYHRQLDALMMLIEDCIDDLPQDVDVDGANGQLTLTFEDGSQIVISRQPVQQEIWVAAKSGGFHLKQQQNHWFCAVTQEGLPALLNRVVTEQSGTATQAFTLIDA